MEFLAKMAMIGGMMSVGLGAAVSQELPPTNVLSFANGTVLLDYSNEYGGRSSSQWIALALIDQDPALGWASAQDAPFPHEFIFELPQTYAIESLVFDSSRAEHADYPGISAQNVTLGVSEEGPNGPYGVAFSGEVTPNVESEIVLDATSTGRWVKLTITGNGGRADYTELMEVAAFGAPVGTKGAPRVVSGTFNTNWGPFYMVVEGGKVRGCYDYDEGRFSGALVGNFLNIAWREGAQHGTAVMALTEDGAFMNGFWYEGGTRQGTWFGLLADEAQPPACAAALITPAKSAVELALDESGAAVLYGIYFDLDSDVLKPESTATLNHVLKWMQDNGDKSLTFGGHTDFQGDDAYNLDLSQRRAASVVRWLTEKGVAADRVQGEGFGSSQPVADNDSPTGRALNRRVEVRLN